MRDHGAGLFTFQECEQIASAVERTYGGRYLAGPKSPIGENGAGLWNLMMELRTLRFKIAEIERVIR